MGYFHCHYFLHTLLLMALVRRLVVSGKDSLKTIFTSWHILSYSFISAFHILIYTLMLMFWFTTCYSNTTFAAFLLLFWWTDKRIYWLPNNIHFFHNLTYLSVAILQCFFFYMTILDWFDEVEALSKPVWLNVNIVCTHAALSWWIIIVLFFTFFPLDGYHW